MTIAETIKQLRESVGMTRKGISDALFFARLWSAGFDCSPNDMPDGP